MKLCVLLGHLREQKLLDLPVKLLAIQRRSCLHVQLLQFVVEDDRGCMGVSEIEDEDVAVLLVGHLRAEVICRGRRD